jgi:hypothetical protein
MRLFLCPSGFLSNIHAVYFMPNVCSIVLAAAAVVDVASLIPPSWNGKCACR